jgi:gluconolactonase
MKITSISFISILASLASAVPAQADGPATLKEICNDCTPAKFAHCGGFLEGPTIDAHGNVWVTDVIGGHVYEISPSGDCALKFSTGGHPNSAKFRSDGKLLIADWKGLLIYDPMNGSLENLPLNYKGEKLSDLNDLAIDRDDGLYITAPGKSSLTNPNGRVFYRAPSGEIRLIAEGLAYPNGVAVSADGEAVLVSEFASKRILSLPAVTAKSPFSTSYVFALTEGGVGVDGMALDKKGRLYGANLVAGEILVYDQRAKRLGSIALPNDAGNLTTNVAVDRRYAYITEAKNGDVWRLNLSQ